MVITQKPLRDPIMGLKWAQTQTVSVYLPSVQISRVVYYGSYRNKRPLKLHIKNQMLLKSIFHPKTSEEKISEMNDPEKRYRQRVHYYHGDETSKNQDRW